MHYLTTVALLTWMAFLHALFIVVGLLPFWAVAWFVVRGRPRGGAPPRRWWTPSLVTAAMPAWAGAFMQPQFPLPAAAPPPWPAYVVLGLFALHVVLAVAYWARARWAPDLLNHFAVQVLFAAGAALVGVMAVTPGGSLGVL